MKIRLHLGYLFLGAILGIFTLFIQVKPVEAFSLTFPHLPDFSNFFRLIPFPSIPPLRLLPTLVPLKPLPTLKPLRSITNPFASPTPTPTVTLTPTLTPTETPTPSLIPTFTPTETPTPTPTETPTPTLTPTQTPTPTVTQTPTPTLTPTVTPSETPTLSPSETPTPTPTTTQATGLVAYWKMEEGSGDTVFDSSGNGHTLSLTNFNYNADSGWSDDKPTSSLVDTKSLLFDGQNDVATAAASSDFNFPLAFTVEAWVNADWFQSGDQGIISKWNGVGYMLQMLNTGQIANLINGSFVPNDVNLRDNSWHHLAITWDGATQFVYVDGLLKGNIPNTTSPGDNTDPLTLGNYLSGHNFHGNIDEVKIWNVARTKAEIREDAGISTEVVLNEFMPKPSDDKDWVEIYNVSSAPENITGWTLADNTGIFATFSATLDAGGFLIATKSGRLNNDGDTIFLRDLDNNLVDSKSYIGSEVHEDKSIGRNPDGTGDWKQCVASSAGSSNSSSC